MIWGGVGVAEVLEAGGGGARTGARKRARLKSQWRPWAMRLHTRRRADPLAPAAPQKPQEHQQKSNKSKTTKAASRRPREAACATLPRWKRTGAQP